MTVSRRGFLGGAAGAAGIALVAPDEILGQQVLRPEAFGAKGDGVTNDTAAFAELSRAINLRGGGTIELRKTTYIVGRQRPATAPTGWGWLPDPILSFERLRAPLVIRGNGARLRCAPGLRYGLFDRSTGQPVQHKLPFYDPREVATPYVGMIVITGARAPIEISDLELDGNLPQLRIGGPFGDTGYQIPAMGLFLIDNEGPETVRNVHTHHHGQDGIQINGLDQRRVRSRFENVVCDYNGRQGVSLVGGRGYDFARCKFNHTGRSAVRSAPGAGVDIEAEGNKTNRDLTFADCEFVNNWGVGMLADSGDSADAAFTRCTFVGTTSWAAWPRKPGFVFRGCTFVGASVHPFADRDPKRATQFYDCRFTDDPRLSSSGKPYLPDPAGHAIVDMAESENVLFSRCTFSLVGNGLLPWSWRATYSDVVMRQRSQKVAYPKGRYLGRSTIVGKVDLFNAKVVGSLTINGQSVGPGVLGGDKW